MSLFFIALFNLLTLSRNINASYCDIKGNVKFPGVYLVEDGDVVNDIILKAGGLKKNSYVKNINLSKKAEDEMVIYIMTIGEYKELTKECPVCECEIPKCKAKTTTITSKVNETTTPLTDKISKITTINTTKTTTTNNMEIKVNINTASIEELVTIPGIGKVTAKNIIEYRESTAYESIEDIINVKGIGDVLFNKIKEYITV